MTRATTRAHLARATLEAIAFEVRDVVDLMVDEAGVSLPSLAVDGGAAANDLLCQLQADQLGVPVLRPDVTETTGLGAAFLAGLGTGVWSSTDELARTWRLQRRFEPGPRDEAAHRRWRSAVERSKGWAVAGAADGADDGSGGVDRLVELVAEGHRPSRGGRPAAISVFAFVAYMSTYSWPDSVISSYMISSVIERRTNRSPSMPAYREKSSGSPILMPDPHDLREDLPGRLDLVGVDHRHRQDDDAGLQRHPGHAGPAAVQLPVRRAGALGVDAQQLALGRGSAGRCSIAAWLALPPERSIGTWPSALEEEAR